MVHSHDHLLSSDAKRLGSDFVDMFTDDPCQSSPPENNLNSSPESIPSDILAVEIFPRLADIRTVIRCSAVSKQWLSLLTEQEFLSAFLRRRPAASYVTFIEFRFLHSNTDVTRQLCPTALITEEGSPDVATAGATSDYKFSAAGETDIMVESSCEEFLLLSRITTGANQVVERHLYIRDTVTGSELELPRPPVEDQRGYAGLSIHSRNDEAIINFRVVYIYCSSGSYRIITLSSKTGQWSNNHWLPIRSMGSGVVAAGGLLFWSVAGYDSNYPTRFMVYNPFKGSWVFFRSPAGLMLSESQYCGSAVELDPAREVAQLGSRRRPHVGVVKGQVRLGQLFRTVARGEYYIKIWELIRVKDWRLVSEVKVKDTPAEGIKWLYLFSFHPDDGDIVFLSCDCDVYKYCLSKGEYQRVFKLSSAKGQEDQSINDWLPQFAHLVTVRIPSWPTTAVPLLPSSISDIYQ